MESKLSSDLFLGKMLWNVARNQNVGPDCDETLCRQRHKVSCTWQTKMTGTITPPVTRKTRILPPSTADFYFSVEKERFTWLSLREKTQTVIFGSRKRQKVCFAVLRAGTIFAAVSTGWRRVIGKDNSILCDCDRTCRHIVFFGHLNQRRRASAVSSFFLPGNQLCPFRSIYRAMRFLTSWGCNACAKAICEKGKHLRRSATPLWRKALRAIPNMRNVFMTMRVATG